MKKIYIFFILLFTIQSVFATHIIGGSISYEYLGGDQYKIKLEVLRDCFNGVPLFDDPASIGIFDIDGNLVDTLFVPYSGSSDTLSLLVPNSICVFPPSVCVESTIYDTIITLPMITGGYTLVHQRCCRSQSISNLVSPADLGMTFHIHLDPVHQNSSPQFNSDFPFAVFVNTPFVYNASATDVDGDSLVYELTSPLSGADPTFPMPEVPSPPPFPIVSFILPTFHVFNMLSGNHPLTIDAESGEMNAIPPALGTFQIAYLVKEFRNGIQIGTTYREFTFIVIAPINNQNYDVSGSILINDNLPLDQGTVQIIERDINTDSLFLYEEQAISADGEYAFEGLPAGVFYIKAIVDPASIFYNNYLPTYYQSDEFWYNANPISQCDTSQLYRDIHLIHLDSLTGGFVLNGLAVQNGTNNAPLVGLNLLLGNENGEVIQARTTDGDGNFKFENLPAGTYQLYADLINSPIDNSMPPLIELTDNLNVKVTMHTDSLTLEEVITDIKSIHSQEQNRINVFPNPTNDKISLSIDLEFADMYSVKIFSIYGQYIETVFENKELPEGNFVEEVSLDGYGKGTYLIEVQNGKRQVIKKVVKY
ncbi:MAG: T9SS type A sorting domain-containing protein [Saprospiraceae bacterium]